MRVFVTGATGFIGSAIVRELVAAGHRVTGLVRSTTSARSLAALGAEPLRGSIENITTLQRGAADADAVIHTAFFHAFSHASWTTQLRIAAGGRPSEAPTRFMSAAVAVDRRAIETLGNELHGDDRALVAAFPTMALTPGRVGTEDDDTDPHALGGLRGGSEQAIAELAGKGVRASAVRLAPVVHDEGDRTGFVARLVAAARENAASGYLGDGRNRWAAVHRLDAAHLFVRALEQGISGSKYHAVAEEGVPVIDLATAIGAQLDLPVTPMTQEQAAKQFTWMTPFLSIDNPVSSKLTRARLGWEPARSGVLDDIKSGVYTSA